MNDAKQPKLTTIRDTTTSDGERFTRLLQRNGLFFRLFPMRKKLGLAIIATIVFSATACVSGARADEKMSMIQTELSNTTISGGDVTLYNPGDSSDSPMLTDSSTFAPSTFSESFSPSPVPEPSTIGLFAAGILTLTAFAGSKRPDRQAGTVGAKSL
jgi:hypothetical protein